MTVWTWEERYTDEISYNRSQTYTFERSDHATNVITIGYAGAAGVLPYILRNSGRHGWWPYKITGLVKDVNDDPVVGADIYLLKGDNKGYHVIQHTQSAADGSYLFYVEDDDTAYMVEGWKWDAGLGEYIRGVTDRDLTAVAV